MTTQKNAGDLQVKMSLRVKCPRCGRLLTARLGESTVECNCHTYCPMGSKPSDCSVSVVSGDFRYNWPKGVHGGASDESDNEHAVDRYCSTHDYYFSKAPVVVGVVWSKLNERAKASHRYFGEGAR